MISRTPIDPTRIRKITGSFSWLDHRLLAGGFLAHMAPAEMLLYFFLVLVGDRNGVSFYAYDKVCALLKMSLDTFVQARDQLAAKSLIACEQGRFQVLQLPTRSLQSRPVEQTRARAEKRMAAPTPLAQVLAQMLTRSS